MRDVGKKTWRGFIIFLYLAIILFHANALDRKYPCVILMRREIDLDCRVVASYREQQLITIARVNWWGRATELRESYEFFVNYVPLISISKNVDITLDTWDLEIYLNATHTAN